MAQLSILRLLLSASLIAFTSAFLRFLYIGLPRKRRTKTGPSHIVAVLGSGGHTAEMISLLRNIDPTRYIHRTYIVSSGDNFSSEKASEIEKTIQLKHSSNRPTLPGESNPITGTWDLKVVPRARKIHQPLYTAPLSSFSCLISCLSALSSSAATDHTAPVGYPDIIITNGPATAVIVILAASLLKFFGFAPIWKMKIIYVESWARVKTLSLSGKLLLKFGMYDKFFVQWEALANAINGTGSRKKVEWIGFLVE